MVYTRCMGVFGSKGGRLPFSGNPEDRPLTEKQRRLAVAYAKTGNKTRAGMIAYNTKDPKHGYEMAQETLQKPHVAKHYRELMDEAGLSDAQLANEWADALSYGKGVDAKHKDYLKALELASKFKWNKINEAGGGNMFQINNLNVRDGKELKQGFSKLNEMRAKINRMRSKNPKTGVSGMKISGE